ncbi:MAG: glycoside hydrolase family 3 C-terminal domain-containing protein [Prevotella sp.]|nr:glycoside hydrolase family 3 C-terminal domain-containing protein [Prevotella sp.]MCI1781276.1 glycoside hydrolase family 3 C-terminal domain-containing protein [Prevotella sp.]MCI1802535.1 glycoside hydrolase family 3 C-terminal domain-containing protein [Prevotella sp.]MCI1816962.1 glycoside hydrolase family 3 C-terminal domain-containing protein [Prevotella sp.]MCI2179750.1 glycoside hydrolase family 3 C-terminal domain-containing protein [Prevotella sp.]
MECENGPRGTNAKRGTTAFPCGVLFGSTWNPLIVEQAGRVMGEESRALGKAILEAPGMNILRDPLCGRFFEYYTEDPFLNSSIAVAMIKGIQSEGVAACAKHFVCNNRENNRNFYMSLIDDRTLHEIYLPAFRAAVHEASVSTIMTSANGVNFEFVSDSRKLLTDILKNQWGFKGFVMTDWLQTRSVEKAAFAGLDVSMPGGDRCGFGTALLQAVKEGRVSIQDINDKVRRILGVYQKVGALDGVDIRKGAKINTKEHQNIARKVAEEGMVLLKNEKNVLPLHADRIKHVLITGPSADKRFCLMGMGGSSWVESPYEVTVLQGITSILGKNRVTYIPSDDLGGFHLIPQNVLEPVNGTAGFNGQYFVRGKSSPVLSRVDKNIDFMWEMKSPAKSIPVEDFKGVRYNAWIHPPQDGKYTFRLTAGGGSAIAYANEWSGAPMAIADPLRGIGTVTASVDLKKGVPFHLCVVYNKGKGDAAIRLEWETPQSNASIRKLKILDRIAQKVDEIVFVGGIDHSLDTEGRDRSSLAFPRVQAKLIRHLSRINRNIHVVLINGSPLELGGWLSDAASVLEAWYPGMEGGTAIAETLFGKNNPSGRLPFTWPKKLADVPAFKLGYQDNDHIVYSDSLMVGYRYYDTKNVTPQFPFGYGLSYSKFNYGPLTVRKNGDQITGHFRLSNVSKVDGAEVVQVYVHPINPSVGRPVHELKYFKKVFVGAGKTTDVDFTLPASAFSYYDVHKGDWKVDRCNYEIEVGTNSQNILQRAPVSF